MLFRITLFLGLFIGLMTSGCVDQDEEVLVGEDEDLEFGEVQSAQSASCNTDLIAYGVRPVGDLEGPQFYTVEKIRFVLRNNTDFDCPTVNVKLRLAGVTSFSFNTSLAPGQWRNLVWNVNRTFATHKLVCGPVGCTFVETMPWPVMSITMNNNVVYAEDL